VCATDDRAVKKMAERSRTHTYKSPPMGNRIKKPTTKKLKTKKAKCKKAVDKKATDIKNPQDKKDTNLIFVLNIIKYNV